MVHQLRVDATAAIINPRSRRTTKRMHFYKLLRDERELLQITAAHRAAVIAEMWGRMQVPNARAVVRVCVAAFVRGCVCGCVVMWLCVCVWLCVCGCALQADSGPDTKQSIINIIIVTKNSQEQDKKKMTYWAWGTRAPSDRNRCS